MELRQQNSISTWFETRPAVSLGLAWLCVLPWLFSSLVLVALSREMHLSYWAVCIIYLCVVSMHSAYVPTLVYCTWNHKTAEGIAKRLSMLPLYIGFVPSLIWIALLAFLLSKA